MRATAEVAAEGMGVGYIGQRAPTRKLWVLAAVVAALGGVGGLLASMPGKRKAPEIHPAAVGGSSSKLVEDALWLTSIGDFEGGHLKLMGIPDDLKAADDPDFQKVEGAWADWKFEKIAEAKDPAQKKALLKEIAATATVPPKQREKAATMIRELESPPPP
jgi:hypothetical protein